jgi:hypothetical protein
MTISHERVGFASLDDLDAVYRPQRTKPVSVSNSKDETKQGSAIGSCWTVAEIDPDAFVESMPGDEDPERDDINFKNTSSC